MPSLLKHLAMRISIGLTALLLLLTPLYADDALFCELYAPGHFGNWYEVAGEREMRDLLAEAKHWGYTRYGDWFDTLDCSNPFSSNPQYNLGKALWDRKKTHFATAQALGLHTDLIITPNHVFTDQVLPAWKAETGLRVFGQLICPSVPAARKTILDNYRNLLSDLAKAGVRLDAITAAPYDYGGCHCERCKPWILTFAALARDIHALADQYHPGIELHFIGWWWSEDEHRQFATWMDTHAPGLAKSIALHIPYDKTAVSLVPLPRGCRRHAFVHIGYGEQAHPRDVYGRTGPVIAAQRLQNTVGHLAVQNVVGVTAYSEGIFDDVNKVLLAKLFTGKRTSAEDVLCLYAGRYFDADAQQAQAWCDWLIPWGIPFGHDATTARISMARLSGAPQSWRRRQWALKADMFIAHQTIENGGEWTPKRLAHAEAFWRTWEELQRTVYGTGPLRHILGPDYVDLPWCREWRACSRSQATLPAD